MFQIRSLLDVGSSSLSLLKLNPVLPFTHSHSLTRRHCPCMQVISYTSCSCGDVCRLECSGQALKEKPLIRTNFGFVLDFRRKCTCCLVVCSVKSRRLGSIELTKYLNIEMVEMVISLITYLMIPLPSLVASHHPTTHPGVAERMSPPVSCQSIFCVYCSYSVATVGVV